MLMSSFPPESVEKLYRMFSLVRSLKLHTINYQGATIQLLRGGGSGWASVFEPDTFLILLSICITLFFHTLPQAKYLFHFPGKTNYVYKLDHKQGLLVVLMWRVMRRAKRAVITLRVI